MAPQDNRGWLNRAALYHLHKLTGLSRDELKRVWKLRSFQKPHTEADAYVLRYEEKNSAANPLVFYADIRGDQFRIILTGEDHPTAYLRGDVAHYHDMEDKLAEKWEVISVPAAPVRGTSSAFIFEDDVEIPF